MVVYKVLLISIILLFMGCSGGGGGGGAILPVQTTVSGEFIDDPVQNLDYFCSSGTVGKTDASGRYECAIDDNVTFSMGLVMLDGIKAKSMVTPYDIFPTNIRAAVNLARLLQTLDTNSSDDVIYLDDNLVAQLGIIDFTVDPDSFETLVKGMLGDVALVSADDARSRMDKSIEEHGGTPPGTENHAPVGITAVLEAIEDTTLNTSLEALDIDGNASLVFSKVADATHGTLSLNNDGTLSYKPEENYNGVDTFSYKVNDGSVDSATVSVTITVKPVNDAPVITSASSVSVAENQLSVLQVVANDVDGDTLTYTLGGVDADSFNIDANGVVTFKVAPDYELKNSYSFSVTVSDGELSVTQDISVSISDVDEGSSVVSDNDNDYIPDNIEVMLGMDPNKSDEDGDGVVDGLQSSGTHGDQFFDKQWHIISLGTVVNESGVSTIVGNDLGIKELYHKYMGYNNGNNIIVQVVDTGVDADHEDLVDNMDMERSLDGDKKGDPSSISNGTHGTMVAGIMAARAFNQKGVRGIAPFAKIAGSNWLDYQTYDALEKAWYSGDGANEIAVTNNSWGASDGMDVKGDTAYESYMQLGAENLRDGKGRIYVLAAGNDRVDRGGYPLADANIDYCANSRFPIVVAALRHDNTYASYSSPGANILVSGYAGNYYQDSPTIATATIMGASSNTGDINEKTTWSEDVNENYTFAMNGTSAATPVTAASVALVLEACPDLTWRDVRYLIAKNAKQIDTSNSTWVHNAAGLWHSRDYGFGLVNPTGMIEECTGGYTNLGAEKTQSVSKTFDTLIPDNNTVVSFDIDMAESMKVEWVEVTIDNNSTWASDYFIDLISPAGTKVRILDYNQASKLKKRDWLNGGFRLSTPAMMDEDSQGTWKVEMRDKEADDVGTLKSIKLQVYGH